MPRPVFGQADWWTFAELESRTLFDPTESDYFDTKQAADGHRLARWFADKDEESGYMEHGHVCWPTMEFLVSRGTRTVLMVRRR